MRIASALEIKSLTEAGQFTGLASVYGNLDDQGDRVLPGAFTDSLAKRGDERPILWSHDLAQPIGLGKLRDSSEGLYIDAALDLDVVVGREAFSRVKKKIVRGLSIGYKILKGGAEIAADGARLLKSVDIFEVSLVAVPANSQAQVLSVKSLGSIRAYEDFLHENGFSKREARALAAVGWKGIADEPNEEEQLLAGLRALNAA